VAASSYGPAPPLSAVIGSAAGSNDGYLPPPPPSKPADVAETDSSHNVSDALTEEEPAPALSLT